MCVSVCVFRAQRSNFLINRESEAKQLYVDFREKQFFFFFFLSTKQRSGGAVSEGESLNS